MNAHPNQPSGEELRRVKAHAKRRCPHCHSPKWDWIVAAPVTLAELEHHLLVRYRCRLRGREFLVEEAKRARGVAKGKAAKRKAEESK